MSAPDDSEERRVDPREPIELKVEYERLNAFFADYTVNISRGGTFIQTQRPLPVGTRFLFLLYIPGQEKPLELNGLVKWTVEPDADTGGSAGSGEDDGPGGESPGMGIEFVYASEEDQKQIERQVERLMVDSLGQLVYRKLMSRARDP